MTTNDRPTSDLYACLIYRDAAAAIEWLCRAFGFTKRFVVPGPEGTIVHSELSLGNGVIMVSSVKPEMGGFAPGHPDGNRSHLSVCVSDPDEHYRVAVEAGAQIFQPLRDEEYGSRGYGVEDLEGHRWYFATYRPGSYWDSEAKN
jgi:uncharacterized glyoxalase superfamily protein PhnB